MHRLAAMCIVRRVARCAVSLCRVMIGVTPAARRRGRERDRRGV